MLSCVFYMNVLFWEEEEKIKTILFWFCCVDLPTATCGEETEQK